jgi:hypothetical protein
MILMEIMVLLHKSLPISLIVCPLMDIEYVMVLTLIDLNLFIQQLKYLVAEFVFRNIIDY